MNLEQVRSSLRIKFLILFATSFILALLFPRGESLEADVSVGTVWIQDDLIAAFSYPILKSPELYRRETEQAQKSVYPIYLRDDAASQQWTDSAKGYWQFLCSLADSERAGSGRAFENPTFLSSSNYQLLRDWITRQGTGSRLAAAEHIAAALTALFSAGILGRADGSRPDSLALRKGTVDQIFASAVFITLAGTQEAVFKEVQQRFGTGAPAEALTEFTRRFAVPNLTYSEASTSEEREAAKRRVSRYSGIVTENERIIAKHDRITPEIKLKIDSYRLAKGETTGAWQRALQLLGKWMHTFALIILLSIYIFLFRKRIYYNNLKLAVLALLLLWVGFITFLLHLFATDDALKLLVFIPAASMLLTIIFDSRVGFYATVIFALICGGLRGNDYVFVVMNIVAGALSVYTVRDIKNRTQIFRSFLYILAGYLITILAFGFERFASWDRMLIETAFAATAALISPVLTYGLLVFFERIFGITTELTLLELSNFDHPLLKELARKAPGSFNHSLTMGTMAEAAAEKTGANPLLARVGAYYHDIGKTIAPRYFVENQTDAKNLHDDLDPEESVKILLEHVQGGIALGREKNLPQEVIDFIPMHHGTGLISFFYAKAKQAAGGEDVNEADFRYAGPKPNSKETAIVMLADTCESAVRSIENPDQEKVETLIGNLIRNKIDDGQLDSSPITFRDIAIIRSTFASILIGQHHRRIRYPRQEEMERAD